MRLLALYALTSLIFCHFAFTKETNMYNCCSNTCYWVKTKTEREGEREQYKDSFEEDVTSDESKAVLGDVAAESIFSVRALWTYCCIRA
jgi:hypothetical protein